MIKKFENFKNGVILNIFICNRQSENWVEVVNILHSLKFPTDLEYSGGPNGLQVLLNIDMNEAKKIANDLLSKFPEKPLVVLSEVYVNKNKSIPIGEHQDDDLVEPGRYFDSLKRNGKRGISIYEK